MHFYIVRLKVWVCDEGETKYIHKKETKNKTEINEKENKWEYIYI